MKKIPLKIIFLLIIIFCFNCGKLFSQEDKITVLQNSKFENLLNEKRKINSSITVNDIYKIQIYNGDIESSKKILIDFKKEFLNLDGTIVFYTPGYKVWVGNFKTRIEAERNLLFLKAKYPNSLIIQPNK
ncbi:MAG: SPOR domain-containing protein [Flavobacteriaceae bacterium]|jgi:hypothetical protein|nr:SPOR domain-containing protein [Flavobacteriaceae bacterium]